MPFKLNRKPIYKLSDAFKFRPLPKIKYSDSVVVRNAAAKRIQSKWRKGRPNLSNQKRFDETVIEYYIRVYGVSEFIARKWAHNKYKNQLYYDY